MMRYTVIVVCGLLHYANGWVFTDIKFSSRGETEVWNPDETDDLSSEEVRRLILQERISLTYIGTKWCGPGNTADNDNDLGTAQEADICCREHDMCPDLLLAGETKYNLTNDAFYTRLSCECDEKFRLCLRAADTKTAHQVGIIYFDGINTKCFRQDYPVIDCVKKKGWLLKKCVEYSYNTNGQKLYQWFDVPYY